MSLYETFISPAEQKASPLQTTSSRNDFLPWYQKAPCTSPSSSSSSLLPPPANAVALVLETEGRSLAWVGSPIVPQPATGTAPWGCHTHPTLALCPGKAERKAQHSTQLELEVVLARLQPPCSQASEKGDSEALAEFHPNLF